jgi:Ca2+-binding RTX toxin-like protein
LRKLCSVASRLSVTSDASAISSYSFHVLGRGLPNGKAGLLAGSSLLALAALSLSGGPAHAGCPENVDNLDNTVTCTDAPLNPYTPPSTLLNGADTINLNSGTANGSVSGGGGPDTFNLRGATVNGTLFGGEASTDLIGDPFRDPQPNHVDTFNLNAGTINAPALR